MSDPIRDINDPAFFDEANLDALAEGVEVPDPDGGAGVDDGVVVDESVAAEDDGEVGDTPVDEGEAVADEESAGDNAPQLEDLDTAKAAYNEVRAYANRTKNELDHLKAELERVRAENEALTEFEYGEEPEAYDTNAFAHMAGNDPRAAFDYAVQSGQTADARAAIASVEVDIAELGGLAAHAQASGDTQSYQQFRAQAANAAALKAQMEGELHEQIVASQNAPLVQAEAARSVAWAWGTLNQETGGESVARKDQISQVLAARPHLITSATPEGILQGYRDALAIASTQPAPVAAAAPASMDEAVAAAVAKHIEATRAAKRAAGEQAVGAGDSRVAPGDGGGGTPSLKDEIYAHGANQSLGARGFMSLGQ